MVRPHLPGELGDYLEGLMEGFVVYDADWRMTYMNAAAEKTLGRRREDLLGRTWHEAFPHAVGNAVDHMYRRVMRNRKAERLELFYEHYGRWFELSASPVRAGGIGVYFRDVTDRKVAEERFSKAFWASPNGLLVTRASDGLIREVNDSLLQLFGFRREEVIGRSTTELGVFAGPADRENLLAAFTRAGGLRDHEMSIRARSGEMRAVLVSAQAIDVGGERSILTLVRDVTERKRMEEALKEADRRKDEFLATLAHELRNPLAPIRNAVEILAVQAPSTPALQAARNTIARQVGHMVRLIDDLLDVSRISHGKLELRRERVALAALLEQAIETTRPHLRQELRVSLPFEQVWLEADPVRLAEIFSNLLHNACKYTEAGGTISIGVRREGAEAVVSVKDTGIGIAPEHLSRVFEMFSQVPAPLERTQGGLGIGLALARALVAMHGGAIEARSDGIGKGAEFIVRLPVVAGPAGADRSDARAIAPARGVPRRILVVDDNRDGAASLSALLRLDGHDVQTAYNGVEALQQADSFRPEVVFLDLGMPKMDGYDTCRALRSRPWGKSAVIIAITGYGQADDRRKSRDAGFDDHLVKPVELATLAEVVKPLSDSGS